MSGLKLTMMLAMVASTISSATGFLVCAAVHGPDDHRGPARIMTTNCEVDVAAINAITGNGSHYSCHSVIHESNYQVQIAPGEPMITATFVMTSLCPQTEEYGGAEAEDDVNLLELDAAVGNGADFRCGHHRAPRAVGGAAGHQFNWYSIVARVCPRTEEQRQAWSSQPGVASIALINAVEGVDPTDPRVTPTPPPPPTTSRPSASPSASPTTPQPTTAAPTRAILNTAEDCGVQHLDCTAALAQAYDPGTNAIGCVGGPGPGRCTCIGAYHCSRTTTMGQCLGPMDRCLDRDMTAAPSTTPTTSEPTTAVPSAAPATSQPTPEPSFLPSMSQPTSSPTSSPTTPAPTTSGDPVLDDLNRFELQDLMDCNAIAFNQNDPDFMYRQQLFNYGTNACPPPTAGPTASPTTPESVGKIGASSAGEDDSAGSSNLILPVVLGMALLVIVTIGAAVIFVKKNKAGRPGASPNAFENPMYASAPGTVTSAAATPGGAYMDVPPSAGGSDASSGYMDVPAGGGGATGYMDVSASGVNDDDEEDV